MANALSSSLVDNLKKKKTETTIAKPATESKTSAAKSAAKTTSTAKLTPANTGTASTKTSSVSTPQTKTYSFGSSSYTFKRPTASAATQQALQTVEGATPAPYQSKYGTQIDNLVTTILNGGEFKYDYEADPIYQQYKNTYTRNGNLAMKDTMANAAALAGGYGSSYATSAGAQAYNQYMQDLNNVIPELEQLAYQRWMDQQSRQYNNLSMLQGLDDTGYGRYRDSYSDWLNERAYQYGKYQDELADEWTMANTDYSMWNAARAAALAEQAARSGGSGGGGGRYPYQLTQDEIDAMLGKPDLDTSTLKTTVSVPTTSDYKAGNDDTNIYSQHAQMGADPIYQEAQARENYIANQASQAAAYNANRAAYNADPNAYVKAFTDKLKKSQKY